MIGSFNQRKFGGAVKRETVGKRLVETIDRFAQ